MAFTLDAPERICCQCVQLGRKLHRWRVISASYDVNAFGNCIINFSFARNLNILEKCFGKQSAVTCRPKNKNRRNLRKLTTMLVHARWLLRRAHSVLLFLFAEKLSINGSFSVTRNQFEGSCKILSSTLCKQNQSMARIYWSPTCRDGYSCQWDDNFWATPENFKEMF